MTNHIFHRNSPRREAATRRAFFVWMAAYVVVILAIAAIHTFGGIATGTVIDQNGIQTQQAKITGEPQSSIVGRPLPQIASVNIDG